MMRLVGFRHERTIGLGRRAGGLLAVGVAIMLAAGAVAEDGDGGADAPSAGPPPTPVRVAPVEERELQERRRVTGELRAIARSRVATIEPGLVTALPVEEGRVVTAGDVLATLDGRRLELELSRLAAQQKVATATLAVREAEHELEQRDFDMMSALDERRASNPKELADAESELKIAAARRDAAAQDVAVFGAEMDLVRTRIEDMTIKAPFDGIVVAKHVEVGEWLAEGSALVEIVSVGAFDAWLDVPQRFAGAVLGGSAGVQVTLDASGRSYPAALPSIVPLVDTTARSFSIFLRLEDPEAVLAPGMSVTGWVPTGSRQKYLTVPRDALLRNRIGYYVYVARGRPGGPVTATPAQVEVLFEDGDRVAIESRALAPGDRVVIEGNERLHPMMPIAPTEAPVVGTVRGATGGEG